MFRWMSGRSYKRDGGYEVAVHEECLLWRLYYEGCGTRCYVHSMGYVRTRDVSIWQRIRQMEVWEEHGRKVRIYNQW